MKTLTLFTSPSCSRCLLLKDRIGKMGLDVKMCDITQAANMELAREHKIQSIPQIMVQTNNECVILKDTAIEEFLTQLK